MIRTSPVSNRRPADSSAPAALQVEVIADLVCPWCYLGKRRLDEALAAVRGPSHVSWYPFQLNPEMPAAGMAVDDYLRERFGDPETLKPAMAELQRNARAEGVNFHFDRVRRVPNTLDAHRLMKLAESGEASTSSLAEALMSGFFEHGMDISDRDVLVEIGERQGLEPTAIRTALDDEATRQIVLSQEAQVRRSGVTGVPDFLVNRRLFVVGAQSTASLVRVFDRVMFGEESDQPVSETLH